MMKILHVFLFLLFSFLFVAESSYAAGLAVYPMEHFVQSRKHAIYTATNQQSKAIAVEVDVESWTINEDGEEIRETSETLIAYPSQFILKGNTSRRIKVGMRNKKKIKIEQPYRVTIRELPIVFELQKDGTNQVYMANAYRTSYYLQPSKRTADVILVDSEWQEQRLHVRLRNQGNVHTHIKNPELELLMEDGSTVEVDRPEVVEELTGQNLHAQMTRRFTFDLTEESKSEKSTSKPITGAILRLGNGHNGKTHEFTVAR